MIEYILIAVALTFYFIAPAIFFAMTFGEER